MYSEAGKAMPFANYHENRKYFSAKHILRRGPGNGIYKQTVPEVGSTSKIKAVIWKLNLCKVLVYDLVNSRIITECLKKVIVLLTLYCTLQFDFGISKK